MEALKQARGLGAADNPRNAEAAAGARPDPELRQKREAADSQSLPPKPPRPARAKVGRLAAAKFRQLQRAREAAAGLESLARGEIEEAIVEIVPRGGKGSNHRRPMHPAPKR